VTSENQAANLAGWQKRAKMKPARFMTSEELSGEIEKLDDWRQRSKNDDVGRGGSSGEWIIDRMREIDTELQRRGILRTPAL